MTGGQRNAVRSANSYLEYTSFSRQGLIEQLEYEDYSTEDATFAVDYVAPDWNEQAAKSAESYLEYTSFSRQGLIDQLVYEGFTYEQAQYGVDQTGL
jgi:SOS response regulatory protein OraA/RecX